MIVNTDINFIKEKGLPIDSYIKYANNLNEVEKYINEIKDMRFDLNYDIDGVVIAIDDIRTRELLGYTVKFPKWAIAFFNPSIDLNLFTKSLAVLTPTFGIPSEYINLYNSGVLLLSIAPRRF